MMVCLHSEENNADHLLVVQVLTLQKNLLKRKREKIVLFIPVVPCGYVPSKLQLTEKEKSFTLVIPCGLRPGESRMSQNVHEEV